MIGESFWADLLTVNQKLYNIFEKLKEVEQIDTEPSPKELEATFDNIKLYHYKQTKRKKCPVPILIVYALVNRYYMMDLQKDRSFISKLLEKGLDIYIIDWDYPERADRYRTMEDYIDGYINDCVDFIRNKYKLDKINLLGVCQGGTFSVIYSALYPEKIKNLAHTCREVIEFLEVLNVDIFEIKKNKAPFACSRRRLQTCGY
jgi:polyhydroxyalkanoate synthase